jgi:sister-chromatid-cohesion protein PDS5
MTNLYYGTVKGILERVSSVMIDREAIQHLVGYVMEVSFRTLYNGLINRYCTCYYSRELHSMTCKLTLLSMLQALKHGDILNELGLDVGLAGERGLRLLFILSFIFPSHFLHQGKFKRNNTNIIHLHCT